MLKTEEGALDIFTKMAANETAIMEMTNGSAIDLFKMKSPLFIYISDSYFLS